MPAHDDTHLFEMLILEGAQAGLSWETILNKRENYRAAFDRFDAGRVASYNDAKLAALLGDPGIVRNRLKVNAAVQNAKAFLQAQEEFGSFDCLHLAVCGRQAGSERLGVPEGGSRSNGAVGCHEQRSEQARV